jgi:hypothetical protein
LTKVLSAFGGVGIDQTEIGQTEAVGFEDGEHEELRHHVEHLAGGGREVLEAVGDGPIPGAVLAPDSEIEKTFEDGEWVIIEWRFGGTMRGEFARHAPTGHSFTLHGCEFFHVTDGKIRFQRGYWDRATWFKQLGCRSRTDM